MPGNEEADKLAKEGTNGDPPVQIVGILFVVDKGVIRDRSTRTGGKPVKVVASPRP
jgi:hypothetical protein